jgi:hypothetical protein
MPKACIIQEAGGGGKQVVEIVCVTAIREVG